MKISLLKLNEGLNRLNFQFKPVDLGLSEKEETLRLFPNEINADIEVQKFSDKFFIKVNLFTIAHCTCDRCLDEFEQNLENTFQLVYSRQVRYQFENEEYRSLSEDMTEIDLSNDIRENLLLMIPMKQLCQDDCLGLCSLCGTNLNIKACNCEQYLIDPRWETLKNLQ